MRRRVVLVTPSVFALCVLLGALAAAAERAAGEVVAWLDDPWRFTDGGTMAPTSADLRNPWQMSVCRNDTEQAFIGLMNTGESVVDVTVSLTDDFPAGAAHADLLVAGGIKSKRHGNVLVNLFTPEQVASFGGAFPPTFTNTDQIRDFPTLHLAPKQPAWVWLRVMTFADIGQYAGLPPGDFTLTFRAAGKGVNIVKPIRLTVLPVVIPSEPPIDSIVYGDVDERDSRLHHTTVRGGYNRYVFHNMLVQAGLWGKPMAQMAREDPAGFQRSINEALEMYLKGFADKGIEEKRVLVEIYDEPADGAGDDGADWAEVAKAVKRYRPDIKIFANPGANWSQSSVTLERCFKPMDPYVDVWMPYMPHYDTPEVKSFLKSTGKPLWFYATPGISSSRDEKACTGFYRKAAWFGLKHDLDGIGFWAGFSPYGDMWDDFDSQYGLDWEDACVVFPSSAGAITTRNWEAWRETLEDASIYRMLERALEAGVVPPGLREPARKWLDESPEIVLNMQEGSGAVVDRVRARALRILAALQPQ
jgi:hypothetical protein